MKKLEYSITLHKVTLKSVILDGTKVKVTMTQGKSRVIICADTHTERVKVKM